MLLEGKKGLVMGIANERSIAWGIAHEAYQNGAKLCLTYQNELFNDSFQVISDSSYYHNPYVNKMWPEIHTFRLSK